MFMRSTALACFLLQAFAASPRAWADPIDLIVNGGFEQPETDDFVWELVIPGWTTTFGPAIEIQASGTAAPSYQGRQIVELDSDGNSGMAQTVATIPGEDYLLSFAYFPRAPVADGFPPDTNDIEVYFDGVLLDTLGGSTYGPWTVHKYPLVGVGTTQLEFRAAGTDDTYGGLLDAVRLMEGVPEPSGLAWGVLLLGAALIRRGRA